ncbi:5'-nucleotidase [Actinomyces bovis]|uniref:5'-nucleotidase n=1 Tax=Actinomyces bovis TaxID=1658 RepID=A0ABY1VKS6_9ACTO|nr:5'-nucleotidase [Actinomyces bovis]VEG54044.1 5'-nucleotidase [Actinomyces israelii]
MRLPNLGLVLRRPRPVAPLSDPAQPLALSPAPTVVLLDLDGTLTDSAPVILQALRLTHEELGMEVPSDEELMRFVGPPLSEGFRLNAGLEGERNAQAVSTYRQHYRQIMHTAKLYPGIRNLLEALEAAAVPVSLATSKNESLARHIIEAYGLAPCFTVIAGAGEGDKGGAKSEVVRSALDRLAAAGADISHPVHVGDLSHDVEGARKEGVDCVGVLWGYGSAESLQGAVALAKTPAELAVLLGVGPAARAEPGNRQGTLERVSSGISGLGSSLLTGLAEVERVRRENRRVSARRYLAGQQTGANQDTEDAVPFPLQEAAAPSPERVLDTLPTWLVRGGLGAWLTIGLVIAVGMVFFATSKIVPVFVGLFIALVLTAILNPLTSLLSRFLPRYPAAILSLLIALGGVSGLVFYVVNSVVNQWNVLALELSNGLDTIIAFLEHGPLPFHVSQQQLSHQLAAWLEQGKNYLRSNAPSLATEVLSNARTVVDVFAVLALALFTSIFFLASGSRMWRWFLEELPVHLRGKVHRAAGAGWYTFSGYARGTVLVALTDAIMAGIFLQFVGVPLAAPLAVLVFIGAFIPIVGAPAAMIIAMLVALASGGLVKAIVVGLGVAIIGQIEGHILQPLIMGRQVSLHPVVVIIAVAVGTYAAGLLGAIVAVPLISVLWSVYAELRVKEAPISGALPAFRSSKGSTLEQL